MLKIFSNILAVKQIFATRKTVSTAMLTCRIDFELPWIRLLHTYVFLRASQYFCVENSKQIYWLIKVIPLNCIAHSYCALARAKRAHAENMHWCGFIDAKSIP